MLRMFQGCQKLILGHFLTPWGPRELGVAPRGQSETSSNQNISLTKDVRYVSRVTKINFGSLPDPLGSSKASGLARRSRATYIQSEQLDGLHRHFPACSQAVVNLSKVTV